MKITVVTVCYNAEATIEKTVDSVLRQTYRNIEYLIIDGKSTDQTLIKLDKYLNDNRIILISEKDKGLYNAMNKALDIASGEYIIYMNSGDVFYDNGVIKDMVPNLDADLVYGNVVRKKNSGDELEKYHGKFKLMFLLLIGRMMSHQSLFVKTQVMKKFRFDEAYKICADYNFVVRAQKEKCKTKYIDRTVSVVENISGISSQIENLDVMRKEDDRSLREYFPIWYYILKPVKFIVRHIR